MMKKTILLILVFLTYQAVSAQNLNDLTFGTDTTIEVVSWNIENFPKNNQTTTNYVKQIIENINADVFAFQEIWDTTLFKQMLSQLPQYAYFFESSWYGGLAYIYKTSVIQINNIYEIYTTSPYWSAFPRAPMVMDLTYMNNNYVIINNHYKCCGDGILDLNNNGDEETRRYFASNLLKNYIDTYFSDKRVIVVGDLNDEITDSQPNNVFINIINDNQNYHFADMDIALGNSANWSYPSWPSQLDHILITNELFSDFQNGVSEINVLKIDEYLPGGWNEYETNISDHRPIALKIFQDNNIGIYSNKDVKIKLKIYPNPVNNVLTIYFPKKVGNMVIHDISGKVVFTDYLKNIITTIDLSKFTKGCYYVLLKGSGFEEKMKFIKN